MVPVETPEGQRYKVYPGRDPRVMRVVRKIVRGLCHYHHVMSPVPDELVWADVLKYAVPDEFLSAMEYAHCDSSIAHYRFQVFNDEDIHSAWLLTLFERRTFVAVVGPVAKGREVAPQLANAADGRAGF